MAFLLGLSVLWTLPVGLICLSWMGAKLGARAPFMLFFPFPVMVIHFGRYLEGGIGAASAAAAGSMESVPMVFSWAVPYFHVSKRLAGRLSSRTLEAVASFAAATGIAAVVQAVYTPWWTPLMTRPVSQFVGVVAILVLSALLLRLPPNERAPTSAVPTLDALVFRVTTVVAIVGALFAAPMLPAALGIAVYAFLGTFPRMTFEMTVSTHVINGVTSARQILAGLPIGVTIPVVWSYSLAALPARLPEIWVLPVALCLTTAWCGLLVAGYLWLFGVFRVDNRLYERDESTNRSAVCD